MTQMKDERRYDHFWDYYNDLFTRLDYMILLAINLPKWSDEELYRNPHKGLVMSEQEVYELLSQGDSEHAFGDTEMIYQELLQLENKIDACLRNSVNAGMDIPLIRLADRLHLNDFETMCVFICLAPEIKRKYEKIYAYLQDDMTCKYATPDMIFRLLCRSPQAAIEARKAFAPNGPLAKFVMKKATFQSSEAAQGLITTPLRLDERIVHYLLDQAVYDNLSYSLQIYETAEPIPEMLYDQHTPIQLQRYVESLSEQKVTFALYGKSGSGKLLLARHFARRQNQVLISANCEQAPDSLEEWERWILDAVREAMLHNGVLCFRRFDAAGGDSSESQRKIQAFHRLTQSHEGPIFVLFREKLHVMNGHAGRQMIRIERKVPDAEHRIKVWMKLAQSHSIAADLDWGSMAGKFRFTPGQMESALAAAAREVQWNEAVDAVIDETILTKACYAQVHHRLSDKATRIVPKADWEALILPDEQIDILQKACDQMKLRHVVYGEWGFERKLSYGKGLSMLFSGPPGTGKTMAAEAVAADLNMEIYKIDLSQIISKYIGETEKNLNAIFNEARDCHAILFFDETDALLGKRSEVKDAHDKYANVEVAFLLQKMEEYDGISVLATNYLQNIDDAFMRRITYVIHFPFPDETSRERIWRGMFPRETPIAADVDFRFLARQFQLSGGSIKNIVVASAFLAARDQAPVSMKHILQSTRQELTKQGKILLKEDLKEFHAFL